MTHAVWRRGSSVVALLACGCGGPQEPGEAGASCYRDADCKPGLVCVADAAGERKCTNDTTPLVSQVEGPAAPEGEAPAATPETPDGG